MYQIYLDDCLDAYYMLNYYTSMHLSFIYHASGILYVLIGLHSDNPGHVCSDPGAWSVEDPTTADQVYLEEQAALQ